MNNKFENKTIEELETELDTLDTKIESLWLLSIQKDCDYDTFLKSSQTLRELASEIEAIINIKKEPILYEFDDLDRECLMTIDEFIAYCKSGAFIDSDGYGCYATETQVSNIEVYPHNITNGIYRKDFDHVCWYNR